jgi:gluconokinase
MANGIPLTDDDRWDWLADVAQKSSIHAKENTGSKVAVASCSALTVQYRQYLVSHTSEGTKLIVVFLWAPEEVLLERVGQRKGHYMGRNMVSSQAALMQVPKEPELLQNGGSCVSILTDGQSPEAIAKCALEQIRSVGLCR